LKLQRRILAVPRLLIVLPLWFASSSAPSHASPSQVSGRAEIWFDIPGQPLVSALDAFSAATGIAGVYNGNLANGRTSNAVRGWLPPPAALPLLLKDTGLEAEFTAPDSFVVLPANNATAVLTTPSVIARAALSQQKAAERSYSGLVQESVTRALCAQPETRPGAYRAAISFWIGSSGQVARFRLLASTGDQIRDAAIVNFLEHLAIGERPPANMAQPFTMVVLPQSSGGTINCVQTDRGRRNG